MSEMMPVVLDFVFGGLDFWVLGFVKFYPIFVK
jgi:hypothetical protein